MSRYDLEVVISGMPPERRQAIRHECLNEKLAHRALAEQRCPAAPAMSQQARDRLYARMFPREICQGADANGDHDSLS